MIVQIISGGQTGADRAALDAALDAGFACGGWCPRDRRAEDGPVSLRYPLREAVSVQYPERTALNLRDSDGTVVFSLGAPDRGTALTCQLARAQAKPLLVLPLEAADPRASAARLLRWATGCWIEVLNVAGPRESRCPGIYAHVYAVMTEVIVQLGE